MSGGVGPVADASQSRGPDSTLPELWFVEGFYAFNYFGMDDGSPVGEANRLPSERISKFERWSKSSRKICRETEAAIIGWVSIYKNDSDILSC